MLSWYGRGTNFKNINFDSHEILASTMFWGLPVTNIDTQKRLTSTPLKLGINIEIKVVTNMDRDCSPSRTLSGYPVPPHPVTPYPAFFLIIISLKSRVDVNIYLHKNT
jgi:hypothetical protein